MTYTPKFCKKCPVEAPKVVLVTKSMCREHYNEYMRDLRYTKKLEAEEWLRTHNERGELLDEYGLAPSDYQKEMDRLDKTYGPPPTD